MPLTIRKKAVFLLCFVILVFSFSAAVSADDADTSYRNGWVKESGGWYYYIDDVMQTGWIRDNGYWYYLSPKSGRVQEGWCKVDGSWYFLRKGGSMHTGWLQYEGDWYYLTPRTGRMAEGWSKIEGSWYYFKKGGRMKTGWLKDGGRWYYMSPETGIMQKEVLYYSDSVRYGFASSGALAFTWKHSDGGWNCRDNDGHVVTGWSKQGSNWYYFSSDGFMKTGWLTLKGKEYYLKDDGVMATGKYRINAVEYSFAKSGAWTGDAEVRYDPDNIVIVINPGHDATHTGAFYKGYAEHEINLDIALALRDELERYAGVTVYMTREDNSPCTFNPAAYGYTEIYRDTCEAAQKGAQLYISCHVNASASPNTARGCWMLVQNENWKPWLSKESYALGAEVMEELIKLGSPREYARYYPRWIDDGSTYPDGSTADYYGVNRYSKQFDMVSLLIEHGFIDHDEDLKLMDSAKDRKNLGIADATAIARYLGLTLK